MSRPDDIIEERLTISSELGYVRRVSSKIVKDLESRKVPEDTVFDIKLCVEETVRNAIQHGNRLDKASNVRIAYRIGGGLFSIEIEDAGKGFDHNKLPDPTHEHNLTRGSGRGVYLVRRLMDKVEYNDKGNKVKLTKHI